MLKLGRWEITCHPAFKRVAYVNLQTQEVFECGKVSLDTTDLEVLTWIRKVGRPFTGDVIQLSDGSSFVHKPTPELQA